MEAKKKKKKNQNKREIDKKITKEVIYKPYLYHLCTDLSLLVSSFGTKHMYTLFVFIHTNACFGHKSQTHSSHNAQYDREMHLSTHNIQTQVASTCPNPRQGQNPIRLTHTPTHEQTHFKINPKTKPKFSNPSKQPSGNSIPKGGEQRNKIANRIGFDQQSNP